MNNVLEHLNLVASFPRAIPKNRATIQVVGRNGQCVSNAYLMDSADHASITVGRHLDCGIVLDDPFVAARHCQIEFDASGQLHVTDLGTVNGIRLDDQRIARAMVDPSVPQTLTLGTTTLRIRLRDHPLAPERPLSEQATPDKGDASPKPELGHGSTWLFWVLTILFLLQSGAETWFASFNHERIGFDIAASTLSALTLAAVWIGAWALISRLVIGAPRWTMHACIAFAGYLSTWCAYNVVGAGAFAASMVLSWTLATMIIVAVCSFLVLFGHLRVATRLKRSNAFACAALLPIVILSLTMAKLYSTEHGAEITEISNTYLLPPAARLREPADVGVLLKDAGRLKAAVR